MYCYCCTVADCKSRLAELAFTQMEMKTLLIVTWQRFGGWLPRWGKKINKQLSSKGGVDAERARDCREKKAV